MPNKKFIVTTGSMDGTTIEAPNIEEAAKTLKKLEEKKALLDPYVSKLQVKEE